MKKFLIIIFVAVVAILAWLFLNPIIAVPEKETSKVQTPVQTTPETPLVHTSQVHIGGKTLNVEVANTDATRELGLSRHALLSDDQGMLFTFDKPDVYAFWMKDMTFPIDIIWISSDMKVVFIEKNAQPDSYPEIFGPNEKTEYVLEVNAGFSEKNSVKIGDEIKFSL